MVIIMSNVTLYVKDESDDVVQRAMKLSVFHENKSISQKFIDMCESIVAKYDSAKPKR